MADLIEMDTKTWRYDLVKKLYQFPSCKEIMQLPFPRTEGNCYRHLWKHSHLGEYKVNIAYSLLHQNHKSIYILNQRPYNIPQVVWRLIWKVKLPLKILTFIWKILHDSLLVIAILNSRGIPAYAIKKRKP